MRPSPRILFALTWLLTVPAAVYAQATITGVVSDSSGAVLPGVTVEASSPALIEKVRTAVTDGTRPVPHRRSASGRVQRHLHADRLRHASSAKGSS